MNTLENLLSWKSSAYKMKNLPNYVKNRDFSAIASIFSVVDESKIQEQRKELEEFLKSGSIKGEDFWYFLDTLLVLDSLRYRKPISEASQGIKNVSLYIAPNDAINSVVRRMLADERKVHQALGLLSKFKIMLPVESLLLLKKSFCKLNNIEQINTALDILGCVSLEEKLDMLSTNESLASIYLGIEYIYTFRNSKPIMLRMKDYPYIRRYLSTMNGSFAKDLANQLILKTSFGDNNKLTDSAAANYLDGGFASFERGIRKHDSAVNRKAMSKGIKAMLGEDVTCFVNSVRENYLIASTDKGYAAILPNPFMIKRFPQNSNKERFIAKVVRVLQKNNYLIVSQKDVSNEDVNNFTLTTEGELVEVRFRRSGETFIPNVIGHGPVQATVVSPKRFDYKLKYRAQVTKVYDINNCEIHLLHSIAKKE